MNNKPLGLPEGTVRAVLAIIVVAPVAYLAVVGKITAAEYLPIVVGVIAFYFNSRKERKETTDEKVQ